MITVLFYYLFVTHLFSRLEYIIYLLNRMIIKLCYTYFESHLRRQFIEVKPVILLEIGCSDRTWWQLSYKSS